MAGRFVYDLISGQQLSMRMQQLKLSATQLARLSGNGPRTVDRWLAGEQDIPPHVDLLTSLWIQDPNILDRTKAWAEEFAFSKRGM